MTITKQKENDQTLLEVEGRVDTNTSAQLQAELLAVFQTGVKHLVLDFEKVQYISSAGLRVLLIGQKTAASKGAVMELLHVQNAVMAVLDSVGFTKVLKIIPD